jgi:trans-2,3-dihydro-3-hydroxyanthranilate isomerase
LEKTVSENENHGYERAVDYFVLDVFTATRLEGNALAVVLNPGTLTTETMQAIAVEMNLSETTFIERRDTETERREGVRVRIFTTAAELPFAGHPTLGTASLLSVIAPEALIGDTLSLALNAGKIPVKFELPAMEEPATPESATTDHRASWPVQGEMTQRDPEFGEILDPAEVAALTGLSVEDFDPAQPIQIVSTGMAFAIVPLRSAEALAGLRVRSDESSAFLKAHSARWFYVLGPTRPTNPAEPAWRSRMQFNGREDPATGSAAGCAISYLVGHGAVAPDTTIHLRQGVEIGRPSDLFLSASLQIDSGIHVPGTGKRKVTNVRVGGSTILVARGRLFLP